MEEQPDIPKPPETCWVQRTRIEKGLICLLLIGSALITTLIMVLLLYTKSSSTGKSTTCNSEICLGNTLEILQQINTDIDPCIDFFNFVCNNKHERGEQFESIKEARNKIDLQIQKLYKESIEDNDHKIVKIVKTMYNSCINGTTISENSFHIIKDVLKAAGGWPVIEGHKWNGTKFDWLQTSYKLRNLGYTYSTFLDISIDIDPKDENKFIYKISIPKIENVHSKYLDTKDQHKFMTNVAVIFGAEEHYAATEMAETFQFLKDLQWKSIDITNNNEKYHRATIAQVQKKHDSINWLEFIKNIAGDVNRNISKHDYILFPNESTMDGWLGVIFRESKRIHANYMLWKVVEGKLIYITSKLIENGFTPKFFEVDFLLTHEKLCVQEIEQVFPIDPMYIVYLKRYIGKEKVLGLTEMVDKLKSSLGEIINNVEWIEDKDKIKLVNIIKKFKVSFGGLDSYYDDDTALDNMAFELNENETNFLQLLAQASKNYFDLLYGLVKKQVNKSEIELTNFDIPLYKYRSLEIVLPINMMQDETYTLNRPNYLNYPRFGFEVMQYILYRISFTNDLWSKKTLKKFNEKMKCLNADNRRNLKNMINVLIIHDLAVKYSYDAYNLWLEENEEEKRLPLLEYKPKQLFWIYIGSVYCNHWNNLHLDKFASLEDKLEYYSMIPEVLNNNDRLKTDFSCPIIESNSTEVANCGALKDFLL